MGSLRSSVIRLAYSSPNSREVLLPILRRASYYHPPNNNTFELDSDHVLTHVEYGVWKAYAKEGGEMVASFVVSYYHGSDVPSLTDAMAYKRQLGLGRKALRILVRAYGELRSSHSSNTSDEAQAAWKSLGAHTSWDGDIPIEKFGGRGRSYYYLSKSDV
jgi:hypothetical protein